VPEHDTTPTSIAFWKNASMNGGPAPVRAYIDELLPDVLEGRIDPGRVFDRTGPLDEVPDGYRAMNDRDVFKFQIVFWRETDDLGLPRDRAILESGCSSRADVAQLVEHFTRNEGVPGSSPGVGFASVKGLGRHLAWSVPTRANTMRTPRSVARGLVPRCDALLIAQAALVAGTEPVIEALA